MDTLPVVIGTMYPFLCGAELSPNESYGHGPGSPGMCMDCGSIIMEEVVKEMKQVGHILDGYL